MNNMLYKVNIKIYLKTKNELASKQDEQSKISDTQNSLDSFLASAVVIQPASSGSSSSSGSSTKYTQVNVPTTNKYGSTVVSAAYSKLGCPYVWGQVVQTPLTVPVLLCGVMHKLVFHLITILVLKVNQVPLFQ